MASKLLKKLKKTLGKVAGVAAPFIGSALGGPIGGVLGGMFGAKQFGAPAAAGALAGFAAPAVMDVGTMLARAGETEIAKLTGGRFFPSRMPSIAPPSTGGSPAQSTGAGMATMGGELLPAAWPGGGGAQWYTAPTVNQMTGEVIPASAAGGLMRGMAGGLGRAFGRGRGLMTAAGQWFTTKKILALVKTVGIEAAAVALGVSAVDLAHIVMSDVGKKRRARGITGRDMRTTNRTINKVERLHCKLAAAYGQASKRTRARCA